MARKQKKGAYQALEYKGGTEKAQAKAAQSRHNAASKNGGTGKGGKGTGGTGKGGGADVSRDARDAGTSRRILKRVLIGIGILLVVLIAAAAAMLLWVTQRVDTSLLFDQQTQAELNEVLVTPVTPEEPYYVLLLGSDSRTPGDYSGLSDTIILARVDPEAPQATLLSIPRDTEIQLEGYGTQKINAAYAYEQQAGAIQAVSDLCGVDIAHYVEVDFEGVIGLVDILGGVTVNVPLYTELNGVVIEPGEQTLNGERALIFSRCRQYDNGDFQRVVNQRILIQAIAKKVLDADPVSLPGLIERLAACVKSDVSSVDAAALLLKLRGMDAESMYMETIPCYNNYHDGSSYLAIKEPEFSEMMERVKQGLPPIDPNAAAADGEAADEAGGGDASG
jgi:LCP family protein required for cell wall assembly